MKGILKGNVRYQLTDANQGHLGQSRSKVQLGDQDRGGME